jgi:hypothetical protein
MTIPPASSRRRTTATTRPCASSTTTRFCAGMYSISSASISPPRSDMLEKIRSWTSLPTPRSATARSLESTSLRMSWIARSSSLTMSSKVNSSIRTSSASSGSTSASDSSTLRSVPRSVWLRISASDCTPPATA